MDYQHFRTDLPVLLLYNLDHQWDPEEIDASRMAVEALSNALKNEGHPVCEACLEDDDLHALLRHYDPKEYLVFNWCEELPQIPRSSPLAAEALEALGFAYSGSDARTLALSQDKYQVKQILQILNIPTPSWKLYETGSSVTWDQFPAIVKPSWEHCSLGVTREAVVQSPEELAERLDYIINTFAQPALIEEFIDGREFHVTVLGNGELHVLPAAEMDFSAFSDVKDRLCTYESKFDATSPPYKLIELRLPAPLTEDERQDLEASAVAAYHAIGCRDYARMDIRLRDGVFYVLDINPNADISPDTSLALSAEFAGLPYGRLGSLLVNLVALRHPVFASVDRQG
jgi:D-alanine-D-alanine ligase